MGLPALTDRQRALLDHLASFVAKRGYAPSLQEIAHAFGFSSLQGVKDHLKALERKGYVRRRPGQRRAITLMGQPRPFANGIPILGRVPAGTPQLALEQYDERLTLDTATLGPGRHFALQVKGDSMIHAGIHDGDYVLVRQQDTAEPGAIVVALLGDDATVKYLRRRGRQVRLEAAKRWGDPPEALLKRLRIARAFTIYQLGALATDGLERALRQCPDAVTVVSEPLALAWDAEVPVAEARRVLRTLAAGLQRVRQQGHRLVLTAPDPPAAFRDRVRLVDGLAPAATRIVTVRAVEGGVALHEHSVGTPRFAIRR